MIREIEYLMIPRCIELSNGDVRIVIPTEFGPRILFYGLDEGENAFGWHGEAAVETPLGTWKPYGGHRLWAAPENMPLSYAPDNTPVKHYVNGELSVTVTGDVQAVSRLQKSITVTLADTGTSVNVDHSIRNCGESSVEISAWALSIMRAGGEAIVPNEPFAGYSSENLLPVRSMALWSYTDFTDPRWRFEKDAVRLRCDEQYGTQQKFGVLNKQGWAGHQMEDLMFIKRFDFIDGTYPDMNSNTEIYTAGGFIEVETLSPLRWVEPGDLIQHQERWELQ
jgi:hypothetical protein